MNNEKLVSGKEYSLIELLGREIVLSIPDLQRDYCWGVKNLGQGGKEQDEIVSSFIDSIIKESEDEQSGQSSTGIIYAYEWPKGTYQLCDGQQRITTLFLLAGILYRISNSEDIELKSIILREDKIRRGYSALQYGIRETSLHFLDDLVVNYFVGKCDELPWRAEKRDRESKSALVSEFRPAWYYREYDYDPTIQALLCAVKIIGDKISSISSDSLRDSIKNYILHRMTFIFYDMESRTKGEETFVVINNTGEPLTSTENLKPQLIGLIRDEQTFKIFVTQWEEREDFFWHHKGEKELTSDDFSKDFYDWHFLIEHRKTPNHEFLKQFQEEGVKNELTSIQNTFDAFCKFYDYCVGENAVFTYKANNSQRPLFKLIRDWDESKMSLIGWLRQKERHFIMLPIIAYIKKFAVETELQIKDTLFFRRLLRAYLSKQYKLPDGDRKWEDIVDAIQAKDSTKDDVIAMLPGNIVSEDNVFNYGELFEMEIDASIRMNTDVLFSKGATAEGVRNRYKNFKYLRNLGEEKFASEHIIDSNVYRVLRVFKDWGGKVVHQYNMTWDYYGRFINNLSVPNNEGEYKLKYTTIYASNSFIQLIDTPHENISKSILDMTKHYVAQHDSILEMSKENYTPENFLKGWVYAKLLSVWGTPQLLSLYNEAPFGGFKQENPANNLINPDAPFSLANCIARRFWRGGYDHADADHYTIVNFDTPLFSEEKLSFEQWDTHRDNCRNIPAQFFEDVMQSLGTKHSEFLKDYYSSENN